MSRFLYKSLIWMHPPSFRERFGDEMLCIFDDAGGVEIPRFFVDGLVSLLRQWFLRSDLWKMDLGAVLSTSFLLGWIYSDARSQIERFARLAARNQHAPVDYDQFNREAAQAVAMLTRFREVQNKKAQQHPTDDSSSK